MKSNRSWRMRDLDIPTFTPDSEKVSPLFQEEVYVIMWRSDKSGGTYSIIRKSREGMLRYVYALELIGWKKEDIKVMMQNKPWVPLKKSEEPKNKRQFLKAPREDEMQ